MSLKHLSPQDWETLIDDFQSGPPRLNRWTSIYSLPSLLDLSLSSLLKKDLLLPLKTSILTFIDEFSLTFFSNQANEAVQPYLDRFLDTIRVIIQSPVDGVNVTFSFKEHALVSVTSVFISIDVLNTFGVKYVEGLVELLLSIINRPSHGLDRHVRAAACECLRELERCYNGLLSEVVGHLWSLCQNERTHACQAYLLLFLNVICNMVTRKWGTLSIFNTSVQLVPFNVPQVVLGENLSRNGSSPGLNYKELRRAMSFLVECPQLLTPCGMMEFIVMIMPLALALELQSSMLKVQFFGMIYTFDPLLCHVVLMMYLQLPDAFDRQEEEIARRMMLMAKETQHHLVFRLLALHWLLGLFSRWISDQEVRKRKAIANMGLNFYPAVFDPLALKALKLDLLAFCLIMKSGSDLEEAGETGKSEVKMFEDGLVSVSAFKWLPPWSTETSVAFRTIHKFLIGSSSHSDIDPSAAIMKSAIFHKIKEMLVNMTLGFQRLVPVIVAFIDRLVSCQKHHWLGGCLLQTFDENLLPRVSIDYKLVSCFPIFDRIAGNDTIPPRGLLELLTRFMVFLVEKHGPDTGLRSWSQGSKVLGISRTMLMHHSSSRLFLPLTRLLSFTCLYFPDLEVRDNARTYLRMLICIPGKKLRDIMNLGDQLLGISPSPHPGTFFNVQSPRASAVLKKSGNLSSYIHLERVTYLLVKHTWSLTLSTLGVQDNDLVDSQGITDSEPQADERESSDDTDIQVLSETERICQPSEPLRVMDSNISKILEILRKHFSCIPDYRCMTGLKVRILCYLRFESEPLSHILEVSSPASSLDELDSLPAIYATVLKFSSSAPYGPIPSNHIPFLLGEPPRNHSQDLKIPLDVVPLEDGAVEEDFRAPVTIELEPREPTPGLVNVFIETNAENGQIIHGPLKSVKVGIEDMFLKAVTPPDIQEAAIPSYYVDLFNALWEACGTPCVTGRETFPLKGGKGATAINGTQSVKLLEVPASSLIRSVERYLSGFVVGVVGEPLVDIIRDGGIIKDVVWKDSIFDDSLQGDTSIADFDTGPLRLKYVDDKDDGDSNVSIRRKNMGRILILIFLPPRFHLLFQMEVFDISTLVRIRTDHWPCLAYVDDYLEALFLT